MIMLFYFIVFLASNTGYNQPLQVDGIYLQGSVVLPRQDLVQKIFDRLELDSKFVVVGAPPAYGKTSLLQLLGKKGQEMGMWVRRFLLDSFPDDQSLYDMVERHTGINLGQEVIVGHNPGVKKLILVDEAHKVYDRENFWTRIIKFLPTMEGSDNYYFVFAVTYNLSIGGSPIAF